MIIKDNKTEFVEVNSELFNAICEKPSIIFVAEESGTICSYTNFDNNINEIVFLKLIGEIIINKLNELENDYQQFENPIKPLKEGE